MKDWWIRFLAWIVGFGRRIERWSAAVLDTSQARIREWRDAFGALIKHWWTTVLDWYTRFREWPDRWLYVFVAMVVGVLLVIIAVSHQGASPLQLSRELLYGISDCGLGPDNGWTYKKALILPDEHPTDMDRFPGMMTARVLSGDIGPLGATLAAWFWYLPLIPAAVFLTLSIAAHSSRLTPEQRLKSQLRRRWPLVTLFSSLLYFSIGCFAAMPSPGFWTLTITIVGAGLASLLQYFVTRVCEDDAVRVSGNSLQIGPAEYSRMITVPAMFGAILLSWTAALLVADARRLHETLEGAPPRLFPSVIGRVEKDHKLFSEIAAVLNENDIISEDDLRVIRNGITKLTSSTEHSIVSLNLCRSGWYIAVTSVCLLIAVLVLGKGHGWFPLFFVLTGYLSIGLAFGVVFYDYYLLDIARYHVLLETFFVDDAKALKAAADRCHECGDAQREIATLQARSKELPKLRSMLSSGFFASSVFAQDTPQVSIESDPPYKFDTVLTCTFQFASESAEFSPDRPLYYRYARNATDEFPHKDIARPNVDCARAVVSNRLGYVQKQTETNATSSSRLAAFFCQESVRLAAGIERDYVLRVNASADCSGYPVKNDRYSQDRGIAALVEARKVLDAVAAQQGDAAAIRRLRQSIDQARPQVFPQRRKGEDGRCEGDYDRTLWPASSDVKQVLSPSDLKVYPRLSPLRAAAIELSRRSLDVTNRIHMSNGLTRHTTLSDMVYFSFVSFTTTGYGDIKAVSGPVRFCVIMENILEILFAAIFFTAAMTIVSQE